jgi:hypothetical protein
MPVQTWIKKTKPKVPVQAIQLTEDNVDEVANWAQAQIVESGGREILVLHSPMGRKTADHGQYVIKFGDQFFIADSKLFETAYLRERD